MRQIVDFVNVSEAGLESSPVAPALAGLRANEARYFKNKYDYDFALGSAADEAEAIGWVARILAEERDIVIASSPLQAAAFEVEGYRMAYVFYESGLSINVMYGVDEGGSALSGSSSPRAWTFRKNSPPGSSLLDRSRSWRAQFGARIS